MMGRPLRAPLWTLALLAGIAPPASAQTALDRAVRWVEIEVGGGLIGGASLGDVDANLRANDRVERPYRLFTADEQFGRTPEFHVRAGRRLGGRWRVEGAFTVSHPVLRADVGADVEGAAPLTATDSIDQYFLDAGVVIALDELRIGRLTPFATAGAGYLRQLHEGRVVVEHGQVYQAGGGVKVPLLIRRSGLVRAAGVRGDLRAYILQGGASGENRPRPHLAVSGGVFFGF